MAYHYRKLDKRSLNNAFYAYVDVAGHFADGLFIRHCVKVAFQGDYAKNGTPYQMIICRVRRKNEKRFLEALQELPKKILICGYADYESCCNDIWRIIEDCK